MIDATPSKEVLVSRGLYYQCRQFARVHGAHNHGDMEAVAASVKSLTAKLAKKNGGVEEKLLAMHNA
jgi:hypothetical protein